MCDPVRPHENQRGSHALGGVEIIKGKTKSPGNQLTAIAIGGVTVAVSSSDRTPSALQIPMPALGIRSAAVVHRPESVDVASGVRQALKTY